MREEIDRFVGRLEALLNHERAVYVSTRWCSSLGVVLRGAVVGQKRIDVFCAMEKFARMLDPVTVCCRGVYCFALKKTPEVAMSRSNSA